MLLDSGEIFFMFRDENAPTIVLYMVAPRRPMVTYIILNSSIYILTVITYFLLILREAQDTEKIMRLNVWGTGEVRTLNT